MGGRPDGIVAAAWGVNVGQVGPKAVGHVGPKAVGHVGPTYGHGAWLP